MCSGKTRWNWHEKFWEFFYNVEDWNFLFFFFSICSSKKQECRSYLKIYSFTENGKHRLLSFQLFKYKLIQAAWKFEDLVKCVSWLSVKKIFRQNVSVFLLFWESWPNLIFILSRNLSQVMRMNGKIFCDNILSNSSVTFYSMKNGNSN